MAKNSTTQNNNTSIANITQLQNALGVKLEKVVKTNKTLSEKAQVMKKVNEAMHKLLIENFPQYYKQIETDVVITSKEGTHKLQRISGYYLLFETMLDFEGKQHKGYKICKPTTYVKGGNSYSCLYFNEIGKTTYTN